jgi:uncharacterized ion transporter superfamily protein YfcC
MSPDKSAAQDDEQKLSSRFSSAYTILFELIILVSTLTWIIPAGKYDRAWPAHSYPLSGPNNAGVAHRILCGSLRFSIHSLGLQVAQVERCFSDLIRLMRRSVAQSADGCGATGVILAIRRSFERRSGIDVR